MPLWFDRYDCRLRSRVVRCLDVEHGLEEHTRIKHRSQIVVIGGSFS